MAHDPIGDPIRLALSAHFERCRAARLLLMTSALRTGGRFSGFGGAPPRTRPTLRPDQQDSQKDLRVDTRSRQAARTKRSPRLTVPGLVTSA